MPSNPQTRGHHPPTAVIVTHNELAAHPWQRYVPDHVELRRGKLDVGSLALAGAEDGAVVRRLTTGELLTRIGKDRAGFEAELRAGRHVGRFVVVVEGGFEDLVTLAPRARPASIIGSLAAWTRRFCPIVFAGGPELAAAFAFRFLLQPVDEAAEFIDDVERSARAAEPTRRT